MRVERADSYPVSIFIAGQQIDAERICSDYCDEVGGCVTVTATEYIYTGGWESGVIVGFINYPRFPASPSALLDRAHELGNRLRVGLGQQSYSIQTPEETIWKSWRAEDCDSDGTATAAANGDLPVPKDCQARAGTASPINQDHPGVKT